VALWVVTSSSWNFPHTVVSESKGTPVRRLATLTVAAILVQLILGAAFRHDALGIGWHIGGAVVVTLLITWTAHNVARRHKSESYLRRPAIVVSLLLVCQVGLGIGAYLSRLASVNDPQPLEPMVSLTVAHVVVGALTLAAALVLAMRCYQVLAPRVTEVPVAAGSEFSRGIGGHEAGRA
jgi:heme A synthase